MTIYVLRNISVAIAVVNLCEFKAFSMFSISNKTHCSIFVYKFDTFVVNIILVHTIDKSEWGDHSVSVGL